MDPLSLLFSALASMAAIQPRENPAGRLLEIPLPTVDGNPFRLIIPAGLCTDEGEIQPMKSKLGTSRGVCNANSDHICIKVQQSALFGGGFPRRVRLGRL
jgi:hypothetical protein